jgi:hypothetical protein
MDTEGGDDPEREAKEAAAAASKARIDQVRSNLARSLGAWNKIVKKPASKAKAASEAKKLAASIGNILKPGVATIGAPTTCAHDKKLGKDDHSRLVDTTVKTDNGRIHMVSTARLPYSPSRLG